MSGPVVSSVHINFIKRVATYVDAPVLANVSPEVPPHISIAIGVVEGFVLGVFVRHGPDGHVGQADGVGIVVDGVVEVLVAREARGDAELFDDEDV